MDAAAQLLGFDRAVHQGELIVNTSAARRVTRAFALLFAARFPARQMRAVDDFGGDDEWSTLADNSSAFTCLLVPGIRILAQRAYGLAVDIWRRPRVRAAPSPRSWPGPRSAYGPGR